MSQGRGGDGGAEGCTCDWVCCVCNKGVLGIDDWLAQHCHLQVLVLQTSLA